MSFSGCIGKLMANSGLEKVMSCAFAGVSKMLIGKKSPMNIRVFRFVVLELLHGFVGEMVEYEDLIMFLNNISKKSRLADHWINNLIKPVLLIMLYVLQNVMENLLFICMHVSKCSNISLLLDIGTTQEMEWP